MAVADHDFINIHVKLEFERREDGWYSCIQIAHLISGWIGPHANKKTAAETWQKKLINLAEGK